MSLYEPDVQIENVCFPPIRDGLEVVQVEHQKQAMVMLKDSEGLVERPAVISLAAFIILAMADGKRTLKELQKIFFQKMGAMLPIGEIYQLLQQLESANLLENETTQKIREQKLKDFQLSSERKAFFAGQVYPSDPVELTSIFDQFCMNANGPKKLPASHANISKVPVALVSPHIDFERGGALYAWAYQGLSEYEKPDIIIAFGVAHSCPNDPWVMTEKSYQTPYGDISVDKELYQEIASILWYDPKKEEIVHRAEHSLELQAVWLKYLWKEQCPTWVPILCSAMEKYCTQKTPASIPNIDEAIQKMGAIIQKRCERGQKIMLLAGIDLSHVGTKFGRVHSEDQEAFLELLQHTEELDRITLQEVISLSPERLYLSAIEDQEWRNICGLSALYTFTRLLRMLGEKQTIEGKVLAYHQSREQENMVSCASMIFYKKDVMEK